MTDIRQIPVSKLKPLDKNPRKIDKQQFEKLVKNLEEDPEFFTRRPILCRLTPSDEHYIVYAGNQRLQAAKRLKWKTVPCIVDDCITDEQMRRWTVLDNLHHGEFDWDILANIYDPAELLDMGFTETQLQISESTGKEFDESITDDISLMVKFLISIPIEESDGLEKALNGLMENFNQIKIEKKI